MNEELLPCPFCGGEAERKLECMVVCKVCGACTDYCYAPDKSIVAWNRRAINSEIEDYKTMILMLTEKMEEMANIYKKVA